MEIPQVSSDDLQDVMEMTEKLESYISNTLSGNEKTLGMSALMSACINCMLSQCKTLDEVAFYRHIFVDILDSSIRSIEIKEKD